MDSSETWGDLQPINTKTEDESINVEIFCDESFQKEDKWMYIGVLFVPVEIKHTLIERLLNSRCEKFEEWHKDENECRHKCGHHENNNVEIKFSNLGKYDPLIKIAEKWLDFLMENNKEDMGLVYFNILGIDLKKLSIESFGHGQKRDGYIYRRFLRTAIIGGLKYFFPGKIEVENIYHDIGNFLRDDSECSQAIELMKRMTGDRVLFKCNEITLVESNHKKCPIEYYDAAHMVQFIDLILGSMVHNLHGKSRSREKRKIASKIKPLQKRLQEKPKNRNSRYHYYRKQQIIFFPFVSIEDMEEGFNQLDIYLKKCTIESTSNNFYTNRPLMPNRDEIKKLDEF